MSATAYALARAQKPRTLRGVVASAQTKWADIERAHPAMPLGSTVSGNPSFFLALVCPASWRPAIVVVRDEEERTAGVLYLRQRELFGIRTGLFFADSTLGLLAISESADRGEVFKAGMEALLATGKVRGMRLLCSPSGEEQAVFDSLRLPASLTMQSSPAQCHVTLKLSATYEDFLARLSYKIRRNFRYFRNRSANAGHVYQENIPLDEFIPAAWELESEGTVGVHHEPLRHAIEILRAAERPLLVALKSAEGEVLSLVGGWHEANRVVIFIQLNSDKRYAKFSLSLVTRTHLIESLIQQGYSEMIWWGGVSGPISNYCDPVPTTAICLDSKGPLWRLGRKLLESHRERIPKRLRALAEMVIAPGAPTES